MHLYQNNINLKIDILYSLPLLSCLQILKDARTPLFIRFNTDAGSHQVFPRTNIPVGYVHQSNRTSLTLIVILIDSLFLDYRLCHITLNASIFDRVRSRV